MSNKVTGGDQSGTSDYSATKAPENREHVESTPLPADPAQLPGGANGAAADVGMSELDREKVPALSAFVEDDATPPQPPNK
jgi:hypothetical protein